ncbi:hypothetical protein SAMN05444166_3003 [Singulisphaera sp. GP187]|uniref:hypothetical protein n=1 Tax=Singulisphaera sp. GP187 TaxID=1882752 RepID=UPI00092C24A7|nr:hypothetical protein [Singulisphaera sp. GP187]SIO20850.1 hypothetical protein SAMN05444166_3003 [Singulisphaera sp. GP187]
MRWLRLRALMYWVVVVALVLALWIQHERAKVREAHLRSALRTARNHANGVILAELDKPVNMPFDTGTTLAGLVSHVKRSTGWVATDTWYTKQVFRREYGPLQNGIPFYVDPVALAEVGVTMQTPITIASRGVPLKNSLRSVLGEVGLGYHVKDGLLFITTKDDAEEASQADPMSDDMVP